MAKRLDQQFSADERKAWEAGTTKEWADESLAITNENWNGNWDQRTILTGERLVGKIEAGVYGFARRWTILCFLQDACYKNVASRHLALQTEKHSKERSR